MASVVYGVPCIRVTVGSTAKPEMCVGVASVGVARVGVARVTVAAMAKTPTSIFAISLRLTAVERLVVVAAAYQQRTRMQDLQYARTRPSIYIQSASDGHRDIQTPFYTSRAEYTDRVTRESV